MTKIRPKILRARTLPLPAEQKQTSSLLPLCWDSCRKEQGTSILEFVIALVVFSVVAGGIFTSIKHMFLEHKLVENSPTIYEYDQIVRFEIATTMDQYQRLLVINKTEDLNKNDKVDNNEIFYCTDPLLKLKKSQQNFSFPRNIYWGPNLFLNGEENVQATMIKFESLIKKLTQKNTSGAKKILTDALSRCDDTHVSIQKNTSPIGNKSSIYICGYGDNILVELKVAFWDFLAGQMVPCNQLNALPGRGAQAMYRFYHIVPYKDAGKELYAIQYYSSTMVIPKRVDSNTSIKRGLWAE